MAKVMLVQPWSYHDEGVRRQDMLQQWRNGPYSLLLLATELKNQGHEVMVVDMIRHLIGCRGDVDVLLWNFTTAIRKFRPDIIGFSFFSIHYFEVKRAVEEARQECDLLGIRPLFVAGGIHASTEPHGTIKDLGFDFAFAGEGDIGLVLLADGRKPETIPGVVGPGTLVATKGDQVRDLDTLPFPDWSLCDYRFYAQPSYGKTKFRAARTLDMIMSRGCVYSCSFCAYNALSAVRFYSGEYLVDQVEFMERSYGIDSVYFTDSTIGNNRRVVRAFCEEMIRRGVSERVEWYANIRPNQVNEEILGLMWQAGCRFLFYGFESGSQRVLNLMNKKIDVAANYRAAELHNRLRFPYHASMLLGYPGEREEDIEETIQFLLKTAPPIIGLNCYVPLPGSPDYDKLKAEGIIQTDDPMEWRRIGEVNDNRVYADMPEHRFRELYARAQNIVNGALRTDLAAWGCLAPPQSEAVAA